MEEPSSLLNNLKTMTKTEPTGVGASQDGAISIPLGVLPPDRSVPTPAEGSTSVEDAEALGKHICRSPGTTIERMADTIWSLRTLRGSWRTARPTRSLTSECLTWGAVSLAEIPDQ